VSSVSPLWYTARGLGLVLLLDLTAVMVLGLATNRGWTPPTWERFLVAGLHRNLSLLALPLLALHGLTVVLDPYARLGLRDITIPFSSAYRQLWLGLGVLAGELLVAIALTSLIRLRLGFRLWKATHWAAYAVWPLTMLHGLGTGSDVKGGWALLIYAGCGGAVLIALLARLSSGTHETESLRAVAAIVSVVGFVALLVWTIAGPLQPGWAATAGTPKDLIGGHQVTPTP
jgi:sulfoxide reductase heme-binding subunit YedZ